MPTHKLTVAKVKSAGPGRYLDGGGLRLHVNATGARNWVLRYMLDGRSREMGLGGYPEVSLADAREKAGEYRRLAKSRIDPIEHRKETRKRAQLEAAQQITFQECAAACIEAQRVGWKNAKHAAQWASTIQRYAHPVMGDLPIKDVATDHILEVLQPIWTTKTETASRVRGRIESVLDWAHARGYRTGENPARWRGHIQKLLARRSDVAPVKHHPAMPYADIVKYFQELGRQNGVPALALQFTILTAARTGEVIGATWDEIDTDAGIWSIPANRMKARRPHRVPLTPVVLDLIRKLAEFRSSIHVFPGARHRRPISNMAMLQLLRRTGHDHLTVHGFRSSFRDWCAEQTSFPREVAEAALAHVLTDKTEAAYQRGDLFEKRRKLMTAWSTYCVRLENSNVVSWRGGCSVVPSGRRRREC